MISWNPCILESLIWWFYRSWTTLWTSMLYVQRTHPKVRPPGTIQSSARRAEWPFGRSTFCLIIYTGQKAWITWSMHQYLTAGCLELRGFGASRYGENRFVTESIIAMRKFIVTNSENQFWLQIRAYHLVITPPEWCRDILLRELKVIFVNRPTLHDIINFSEPYLDTRITKWFYYIFGTGTQQRLIWCKRII